MKTFIGIITFFILSGGYVFSQQNDKKAREILNGASTAFANAGGIKASFVFTLENTKAKTNESFNGMISMLGNKFVVETPDYIAWYNGTNQWVYMKTSEEVNMTAPSEDETQMISPSAVLTMYQKGFNCKYIGEKISGNKKVDEVELVPQKKNEWKRLVIQVDKITQLPVSIRLYYVNGIANRIEIAKYQIKQQFSSGMFTFDKSKYPNAELIDLR
ncbi:MAG: outer-membrane lipoprotein carrier protein LolA [Candidatus Azobacteroides sp.]|nr:outer-membrane lipoprotein carrier protein LolA [Candidatus Azobacteroides sp.]